jgi:hypothetical protein
MRRPEFIRAHFLTSFMVEVSPVVCVQGRGYLRSYGPYIARGTGKVPTFRIALIGNVPGSSHSFTILLSGPVSSLKGKVTFSIQMTVKVVIQIVQFIDGR